MKPARHDVTGNYAGAVTRLLAHAVDVALAGSLFVVGAVALDYVLRTIFGLDSILGSRGIGYAIGVVVWFFLYWWASISIAGKTPGKALLGLRVLRRDGSILPSSRAALRTVALPLSYLLFGAGFLGIVLSKERRALHDWIAGSAVVYDWGGRTAELPTPISAYLARRSADQLIVRAGSADAAGFDGVDTDHEEGATQ